MKFGTVTAYKYKLSKRAEVEFRPVKLGSKHWREDEFKFALGVSSL